MKRVVVTSIAGITPLANDIYESFEKLIAGQSGIGKITQFDTSEYETKIAGEVKNFNPADYMPEKQARRMEKFSQFAVASSKMLLDKAKLVITDKLAPRTGVMIGVGLGGLELIEKTHEKLMAKGPSKVSPFFIPTLIANMAAGHVSIATGAKGANVCTTTACASGMHAIGAGFTDIIMDRADVVICGGSESTISHLGISGFNALKALSTWNDKPEEASRPFDGLRNGFVMGEGCGLLLLESLEHAEARGAEILAEIVGFGASGDAFHMTAPDESGEGMANAMRFAIREAKIKPNDITHINAHGTSTKLNDYCETKAIKLVFGEHAKNIAITANKSMTGHLLGAAGAVESAFTILSIINGIIPPTINHTTPDPDCDLDYCPNVARKATIEYALCNSFGFAGTNACTIYKRFVK